MRQEFKRSGSMAVIVQLLQLIYRITGTTLLAKKQRINKPYRPKQYRTTNINGVEVFQRIIPNQTTHIIYLHGGAYVHYGGKIYFQLLDKIHKQLLVSVHYIEYPLAPESQAQQTTKLVIDVIQTIQQQHLGTYIVVGDSAGAGMALSISNQLPNIKGYVLLSPWMDVSMSSQTMDSNHNSCGFYTKEQLAQCGEQYAGSNPTSDVASPLYLTELKSPNIHLFAGSKDILSADILSFEEQYPEVQLYYYIGAPHVFPIFPFTKEQVHFIEVIQEVMS